MSMAVTTGGDVERLAPMEVPVGEAEREGEGDDCKKWRWTAAWSSMASAPTAVLAIATSARSHGSSAALLAM